MTWRRQTLATVLALAVVMGVSLTAAAAQPATARAIAAIAAAPHRAAAAPTLSELTGLSVTIDSIEPAVLAPGEPLSLSGSVRNDSGHTWSDAQVYLEMSEQPATDKGSLDDFAVTGDLKFGDRVVAIGHFAQIGAVRAGEAKPFGLTVPYSRLPARGGAGVYHIAVAVLATQGGTRDRNADARADALLPLEEPSSPPPQSTIVTTLIPLTAPVPLQSDGVFAGDRLAAELTTGGRLRNLLDLILDAPPQSVDLVVDPALIEALQNMTDGYKFVDLAEGRDAPAQDGAGQQAASSWLSDFDIAAATQHVDYLPWASPDTSGLAAAGMGGVADAAVHATLEYLEERHATAPVVDWQSDGAATRRGLSVAERAGADIHVVSQSTLAELEPNPSDAGYPPPLATVNTRTAPITATVARSDLAGAPFTRTTTAIEFRQGLASEALVRAMSSADRPTTVIAAPFRWNPGVVPTNLDLGAVYDADFVSPTALDSLDGSGSGTTVSYVGPIQPAHPVPEMTSGLEAAIKGLRNAGRVYTALLTDGRSAATAFERQLAQAGSSVWLWQAKRGEVVARRAARALSSQIRNVTVTGPEFVALSSEAGRFPLTVSNGLDVSVTVKVSVVPRNPALRIDPIDPIVLGPGQNQLIEVRTKSSGSGVTSVRARLATTDDREFGDSWVFDVRATRIGVAIWILLGVLMATLFGGAAVRIVRRFRTGGFQPRGPRSPEGRQNEQPG